MSPRSFVTVNIPIHPWISITEPVDEFDNKKLPIVRDESGKMLTFECHLQPRLTDCDAEPRIAWATT